MDRFKQGTTGAAQKTVRVDEALTDPDANAVTYVATRSDGTSVASGSATRASVGLYQFTLTPTHLAALDTITVAWTYALSGVSITERTTVEVCGDYLFSLSSLRSRLPDTAAYPTAALAQLRTQVEEELERACGLAFVPRHSLEAHPVPSGYRLRLNWGRSRVLRSVSVDGTAWSAGQLAVLDLSPAGWLDSCAAGGWGWAPGTQVLTAGYEHGLDRPPSYMSTAGLDLAAMSGAQSGGLVDPRATRIVTQDGSLELALGGGGGGYFGIPSVDRAVARAGEAQVW